MARSSTACGKFEAKHSLSAITQTHLQQELSSACDGLCLDIICCSALEFLLSARVNRNSLMLAN